MLISDLALSMKQLSDATSSKIGQDYFDALVTFLGNTLGVDYLFIGALTDNNTAISTKSVFAHGQLAPPLTYSLKDTPCEQVVGKNVCVYPDKVQEIFPSDILLQDMGVESYIGAPLFSLEGKPFGLIVALHSEKIINEDYVQTCFDLVIGRIAAEYERLTVTNELVLQEKKLNDLVTCTSDLVWEIDKNFKYIYTNSAPDGVLGYGANDMLGKSPFDFIVEEESDKAKALFVSTLNQKRSFSDLETIFLNKKGSHVYMETSGVPIYDSDGEFIGYRGIDKDITERKEKESELRLSEIVLETATEAVMVTDLSNNIIKVNNAFSEITGFMPEEVLDKNPSILQSGMHDHHFYSQMFYTLEKHGSWQGEIWNRRKNGNAYPQWLTISTLQDSEGMMIGYVALFSDISTRKEYEERIEYQANYDALTGIANRHLLESQFERAIDNAERNDKKIALLFLDLDYFKIINDRFGHSFGDQVLKEAANRIQKVLRKTDTVARLGGDEFAVLLTNLSKEYCTESPTTSILNTLSQPYYINDHEIHLSASIGVTFYPKDGVQIEELLRNADSAMYKAKDNGRNSFHYFSQELHIEAEKRYTLIAAIRKAIDKQEFVLHYQPILEACSNRVIGCEALIRWNSKELGVVSPVNFIPVAEKTGLMSKIGKWVLEEACRDLSSIIDVCSDDFFFAINFSSCQFQQKNTPELVNEIVSQYGLAPHRIHIEITESLMLDEDASTKSQLERLKESGFNISIDDFGTGYSSLSYLHKYPISTLKIDREFVKGILDNSQSISLVKAMIAMSKSLGLKVIAEGIEDQAQAETLLHEGCDFFQGYLFSKPVPLDQLKLEKPYQHE